MIRFATASHPRIALFLASLFVLVMLTGSGVLHAQPICDARFAHYAFTGVPDSVHFYPLANSQHAQFHYTFGDGTGTTNHDPWHRYPGVGTYIACLTVTDSTSAGTCTNTFCDTIIVTATPAPTCNAHFQKSASSHNADSLHFVAATNSTHAHYQWTFGDGTGSTLREPWHLYNGYGVWIACLTVTDTSAGGTCSNSWCDTVRITAPAAPTCNAEFYHYSGITTVDSVHFYPLHTTTHQHFLWTFGDGTSSHDQYPWHLYNGYGTWIACLTVTDTTAGGTCSNTWCDTVRITAPAAPICNAHYTKSASTAKPDSVHFIGPASVTHPRYHWNFGDGTTSIFKEPWHVFNGYGTWYVCLTVTDTTLGGVCSDTFCDSIRVTAPAAPTCDAHFAFYPKTTYPDSLHFYPRSTSQHGHFSWTFGDGTGSHDNYPWHVYNGYGVWYVCLTVTDTTAGGVCTDTFCDSIRIAAPAAPICNAHYSKHSSTSYPDSIRFAAPTNASTAHYLWNFGDGTSSTQRELWHVYNGYGVWYVCLTVTDTTAGGVCSDTFCDSIRIAAPAAPTCNAEFIHYSMQTSVDSVHFYAAHTTTHQHLSWTFGDGTGSHDQNPWHMYNGYGVWIACLTVTDTTAGGVCSDTRCDTVRITAPAAPTCNAHYTKYASTANPDSLHFAAPTNSTHAHYQWNFGDGTGSTLREPWHLFNGYGTWYVCLTVTDTSQGGTCSDTFCDSIRITAPGVPTCNAEFVHYSMTNNVDSVHFYAAHTTTHQHFQWTFGDGTGSTVQHPWHTYNGYGVWIACLTVTDTTAGGVCTDTWCDTVRITQPVPPVCNAHFAHYSMQTAVDSVHFYPLANSQHAHYLWTFGDGTSSHNHDPWHLYASPGTYVVCLTVTDTTAGGTCSDTQCDTIVVPHPITAYPNPAAERVSIAIPHGTQTVTVEVRDQKGRLVMSQNTEAPGSVSFPTQGMSSGVYFYQVSENGRLISTGKFIVVQDR